MIRKIKEEDKEIYIEMAKDFYSSDAVQHNVPQQHFIDTFNECIRSDDYAAGYIMEYKNNVAGYALLAKSFSQEAGGMVLWLEEIYVKPEYRCCGLGHEFFAFLSRNFRHTVRRFRLEVEDDNKKAISLYKRMGFEYLPYSQMIRDM